MGSRARVDLPVGALVDGFVHRGRAVDLSPTGMVFERPRALWARDLGSLDAFELHLDAASRAIRTRARRVWSRERLDAVRFVIMNDVDRLNIAELLDRLVRLHEPLH